MATNRERILDYLAAHREGADDDRLARDLDITQRQQVNTLCNALAREGIIVRQRDIAGSKIINRLNHNNVTAPSPPSPPLVAVIGPALELRDDAAVLQFAYPDDIAISEDTVTRAVKGVLEAEGWSVNVKLGHEHGIDIEARRGDQRMMLESKGEGSRSAMRVNYFLGALGELLQRMDTPDARYGLALPAHRQLVRLVLKLPHWVRLRLQLCFYLVRPVQGGFEVGYIPPDAESHELIE